MGGFELPAKTPNNVAMTSIDLGMFIAANTLNFC